MWARTSSNYVKTQGVRLGAIHTGARLETLGRNVQHKFSDAEAPKFLPGPWLRSNKLYSTAKIPSFSSLGSRYLSSQAGTKSGGEEDEELDEGFSDLEDIKGSEKQKNGHSEDDNELVSEPELSDEDDVSQIPESEVKLDAELDDCQTPSQKRSSLLELAWLLLDERKSVQTALDKYVSAGNTITDSDITHAMLTLRKNKLFWKALQFSEWLEVKKLVELDERHYASRIDLIAKVHGIQRAERYIQTIPQSSRGEVAYRTLLANCVSSGSQTKAEEIFNKMKQLNFVTSTFTCNQMLILYKKTDKKKIADILLYMEKENIKPTQVTYKLLIDTKGQSGDIDGMDQIVETMKADGVELDVRTKTIIGKHYVKAGLKEKAESVFKEMEGSNIKETRAVCGTLIELYASLGKEEEVERLWKICEPNPQFFEYLAAIDAWGQLKNIEKAEAVFERLANHQKLSSRHYSTMLRVYANNKMLNKGKDLMKRMGESGCRIGPLTWDALVKLYVEAGEVEKADSILQKAVSQPNNRVKPLFTSYMNIMEQYSRKGDVHNSEKMFYRMKQAGYSNRMRPFQVLLQSYIKSRTPAYGFRERMMADNIFPNRSLTNQLAQADPFKKTAVSDLLD